MGIMGICCGGASKNTTNAKGAEPVKLAKKNKMESTPGQTKTASKSELKVWGDYFSSESRIIITALDFAGIDYTFEPVSKIEGDNKNTGFLKANPTGQVPCLRHNGVL